MGSMGSVRGGALLLVGLALALTLALGLPAMGMGTQPARAPRPADVAAKEAERLLASGDAAAAEAKAREAIARSRSFKPEDEIEVRPDKGLLFDDMILAARKSYRERRARYFRALGQALEAQKKWPESRKAYRRAMAIEPSSDLPLRMAAQDDLDLSARLDLLLDSYLAPGSDRAAVEAKLLATGAFRTRNALKASLDRRRFDKLHHDYPELELLPGVLPDFQATTDSGTLIPAQLFLTESALVLYVPEEGCARCSEELDGISVPALAPGARSSPGDFHLQAIAFVREADLPSARRIVRLLGVPVGVGRKEGIPASLHFLAGGEIRIVARSGMTQIRLPTSGMAASEIRRRVEAVVGFLSDPNLPQEDRPELASEPLVTLPKGGDDLRLLRQWIDAIGKLELGPAPIGDLYAELNRRVQRMAAKGDADLGLGLLDALSALSGANAAKARALGLVGEHLGEDLLGEAKRVDPSVRSTPSGESGSLFVLAPAESRRLYVQRSFDAGNGSRFFDFVLEDAGSGLAIRWSGERTTEPLGIERTESGPAFFGACADADGAKCRSGRLVEFSGEWKVVFEGEPVVFRKAGRDGGSGTLFESRSALVDSVDPPGSGPRYYRDVASGGKGDLERGLELFAASDFAGAAAAFEAASTHVDPVAPYDESDLVYDRARALEALGKRREALALFRSLGDVSYQTLVDERAARIESGR